MDIQKSNRDFNAEKPGYFLLMVSTVLLQLKKEPEKFKLFTADEYIDLVTDFISLLRPDIVIERFISESPQNLLLAPKWNGLKNFEITSMIDKKLIEKDLWQGKFYN